MATDATPLNLTIDKPRVYNGKFIVTLKSVGKEDAVVQIREKGPRERFKEERRERRKLGQK